jgi:hypothetical protein
MDDARRELYVRALALPGALIGAQCAVALSPGLVHLMAMWVHESGHAAAAWLTGFAAFPGPWITPVADERSLFVTLLLAGALMAGIYHAWQRERGFWVAVASVVLVCALSGAFALHPLRARQLITFAGDGGCFVLGSVLMLTMYARAEHPLRREHLRWVCLAVGALAFMDVRVTWSGGPGALPFGEDDRGFSDASVLTELDGWTPALLVDRYAQLAAACFIVLACAWAIGLLQAIGDGSTPPISSSPSSFPRTRRTASTH